MRFHMSFSATNPRSRLPRAIDDFQSNGSLLDIAGVDEFGFPVRLLDKRELSELIGLSPRWVELRVKDSNFPRHLLKGASRYRLREVSEWWGGEWHPNWLGATKETNVVEVDESGFVKRPLTTRELAFLIGLSVRWVELRASDSGLPRFQARNQVRYLLREVVEWADQRWS